MRTLCAINLDSNLVYAHYILDSTGKATAYPKFRDGGESYEAKSLNYNFKTSKGFITGRCHPAGRRLYHGRAHEDG